MNRINKLKGYVIERKNVYAGLLVKTKTGETIRGMLYTLNQNGLAHDLIYKTLLNYPILGIDPINSDLDLVIEKNINLDELLKYLNYDEKLTQKDLNKIYKKLIIKNWWLKNHLDLFRYKSLNDANFNNEKLPSNIYLNLRSISSYRNCKPSIEEPGYSLIKKRK